LADADQPPPHVFNAAMGARLEVLYASPQIVAQRRRFRGLVAAREGEQGIDVGCGVGHLTCELAQEVGARGRMTGVDASADMLAGAGQRARAQGLAERVALHQADATALGLASESADFVVSVQTYSYVRDIAGAVAEAARVLRPGGRFAVSDVIADEDMDEATRADMRAWTGCVAGALTEAEFRGALAAAGLTDVEIRSTHRVHAHAGSAIIRARKP
jgi:arsenite methyltransferase